MPDWTQYVPPGVYVEENITPLVSVVGVTPNVVGIVGPAQGYRVNTESITLVGTTPTTLAKSGINTTGSLEVRGADGTLYTASDYTLVQTEIGKPGVADNETTIARTGASTITSGQVVYVTYQFTDVAYGVPNKFTDFESVKATFGEPIDLPTSTIISPLSLAAKLAFDNGASTLVLVATPGTTGTTTRDELADAMDLFAVRPEVNIVCPLPAGLIGSEGAPGDILTVGTDLEQFVSQSADDDRIFRVGFISYEDEVTVEANTIASTIASRRVSLVWPNQMMFYNGYNNQVIMLPGYYLAAAVAGMASNLPPQMPLTRKQVRGFAGLSPQSLAQMTVTQKNGWSAGGVMVIEYDRNNRTVVRHGVTTDPSTVMTRELSHVRAKDGMMQLIADTVEAAGLIGSTIDLETPARVKGVIQGCLSSAVNTDLIVAYSALQVRQSTGDPTIIEVKFQYQPSYALNYITVSFEVSVATGAVTEPI